MSKLKPLNGYLILKPVDETEQTYGNIVIPDLGKERPEVGEVLAVSTTYNYNSDKWVESQLRVGQKALIPKLGAARITVEGEEYYICKEQDVYSILLEDSGDAVVAAFLETEVGDLDRALLFAADTDKVNEVINETKI